MKCDLQIPEIPNWDYNSLTVGHVFYLNCEGEWPKLEKLSLELRSGDKNPDTLKLLALEQKSETLAQLKLVSYVPGEHQFQAVQLVDNEHSVLLGDVKITVASVQNSQSPVQEPYPAMGPVKLEMPLIYPLSLGGILILLALALVYRIWRQRQKRKLLEQMRVGESALSPYHDFYKGLRGLQRSFAENLAQSAQDLNRLYRLYIGRTFKTPALNWRNGRILADIKSSHREYLKENKKQLVQIFAELDRAVKSQSLTEQDLEQLMKLVRDHVDRTEEKVGQK